MSVVFAPLWSFRCCGTCFLMVMVTSRGGCRTSLAEGEANREGEILDAGILCGSERVLVVIFKRISLCQCQSWLQTVFLFWLRNARRCRTPAAVLKDTVIKGLPRGWWHLCLLWQGNQRNLESSWHDHCRPRSRTRLSESNLAPHWGES